MKAMNDAGVRAAFQARNAARIQKIQAAAQTLLDGYARKNDILFAIGALANKEHPFEFDLGFALGEGGDETFEIGFNPRVALTSAFHKSVKAVFSAQGFDLRPLAAFMDAVPFYRVSPTMGAEWPKNGGAPKLTFLMEDAKRLMSSNVRREALKRLCAMLGGRAEEIFSEFNAADLDMIAADFSADRMIGLRFFKDYSRRFAPFAQMSAEAAGSLELFESLLPQRMHGDGLIYYKKYEPQTGDATGFKVYYTPPPGAPEEFGDEILSRIVKNFSLEGSKEWKLAGRARRVCAANGLETRPVCLSIAFGAPAGGTLRMKYSAVYFAVGGIPDEFGV